MYLKQVIIVVSKIMASSLVGLVCLGSAFVLYTLSSAVSPGEDDKEAAAQFHSMKFYWLNNSCVFPDRSTFESQELYDRFLLDFCSGRILEEENVTFTRNLCFELFNLSKLICSLNMIDQKYFNVSSLVKVFRSLQREDLCIEAFTITNMDIKECAFFCDNTALTSLCKMFLAAAKIYKDLCQPGYTMNSDETGCIPCQRGEFKKQKGNTLCTSCPLNYNTSEVASRSEEDCSIVECTKGYFFANNSCHLCPVDTFKESVGSGNCTAFSSSTTAEESSTNPSDFSIEPNMNMETASQPSGESDTTSETTDASADLSTFISSTESSREISRNTTTAVTNRIEIRTTDKSTVNTTLSTVNTASETVATTSTVTTTSSIVTTTSSAVTTTLQTTEVSEALEAEELFSSGYFIVYFVVFAVACGAVYAVYYNRQKIFAFVSEGRKYAKRHQEASAGSAKYSTTKYTKLQPSVEEVMPSLEKSTTSKNYIY